MDKARAADNVVRILENRIFSGKLHNGQMFPPERELINEFGVSRTVAREAIKVLSIKGLIDARPHHRPVVKLPNYDTAFSAVGKLVEHLIHQKNGVRHLFNIRIFVEVGLVRLAATDANKTDIANLKNALERNWESIDDSLKFYETDMDFHAVLYSIPNNPIFPALHRSFCDWLKWHWQQMPRLPERNARNYQLHKAIFQAIIDRDPDAAETALHSHLEESWLQLKNTFADL